MRLLLLSNSANFGSAYLDHAIAEVKDFFGPAKRLAFVPFALKDRESYTNKAKARLQRDGFGVVGLTPDAAGRAALERAEGVFVGGGNTFRLLKLLQESGLLELLGRRIAEGMPYMGASAGTNIAAPTIRTTNDMPIVEPQGFDALGVVPFQINPHFVDVDPGSQHMGETREDRLREFLEENDCVVVGLREGSWLRREGGSLRLGGSRAARIFKRGAEPEDVETGAVLDRLLTVTE